MLSQTKNNGLILGCRSSDKSHLSCEPGALFNTKHGAHTLAQKEPFTHTYTRGKIPFEFQCVIEVIILYVERRKATIESQVMA